MKRGIYILLCVIREYLGKNNPGYRLVALVIFSAAWRIRSVLTLLAA
jgi:hypothetical protein